MVAICDLLSHFPTIKVMGRLVANGDMCCPCLAMRDSLYQMVIRNARIATVNENPGL